MHPTADKAFASRIEEFLARPQLSVRQRLFGWLSVSVALVLDNHMHYFMTSAVHHGIPVLQIKEVILQSYLFCGFPNTIEGLIIFRQVLKENGLNDAHYHETRDDAAMIADGTELCRIIYGKNYDKLVENMKGLSSDLHLWMMREGYGKVLSRPVLNPVERELCTVASLSALGRERQLVSHIKGAVNAGAHEDEIHETIYGMSLLVDDRVYVRAITVLQNTLGYDA